MTAINRHKKKNVPAGVRFAAQASVQIVARKICHFIFEPLPHTSYIPALPCKKSDRS